MLRIYGLWLGLWMACNLSWAAAPDEKACSAAIGNAQKTLKEMPAKSEREREDLRKLIDSQEKIITESRRKGLSDCQIWPLVMGNAFKF